MNGNSFHEPVQWGASEGESGGQYVCVEPVAIVRSRHGRSAMTYWVHIARAIDRVTLHRDRCSEVPSTVTSSDFWEGGWFDYPDKERALRAMEQAGTTIQRRCSLCKP